VIRPGGLSGGSVSKLTLTGATGLDYRVDYFTKGRVIASEEVDSLEAAKARAMGAVETGRADSAEVWEAGRRSLAFRFPSLNPVVNPSDG
jgi:hypothetical protein